MFRNMYDTDVTVWSPEGRLLQVREYHIFCSTSFLPLGRFIIQYSFSHTHCSYLLLTTIYHVPAPVIIIKIRSNTPWNQSNRDPPASPSVPPPTLLSVHSNDLSRNYPPINRKYSKLTTISVLGLPDLPPMLVL